MILIIAEKPSLGRNIAAGIASRPGAAPLASRTGYMEGNGFLVTWAFGHLFSLCDIESYGQPGAVKNEETGKYQWTMNNLPCFPEEFRFELKKKDRSDEVDAGVKRQFELIGKLCNREDVDTIVNAGDADREGEIIVRLCVRYALRSPKAVKRLWLPDQTPQTVAAALDDMQDDAAYDSLANEGFARTYIDWLYGVNLTRYATLRTGKLLRVGRVIIPIVKAIYDRDMEIAHFVPGKYLALQSKEKTKGQTIELLSKTRFEDPAKERREADELCRTYNEAGAYVLEVKNKKDKLFPGKLYSLSKLQNALGKKYKMSMTQSLAIVQKLYESGYLTYPRTDTEYMATAEKGKVRSILSQCQKLGYPVVFKDSKMIFDDSKIESHSAITPTYKIPDKNQLSKEEFEVYSTVFRRFIAVFCSQDCIISRSELTVRVGSEEKPLEDFTLKGSVILEPGWTKFDDSSQKDKVLPKLEKGEPVTIDFKPVEKETAPPRHYTIETLNNYLKNPFREEKAKAKEKAENATDTEPDDDTMGSDDAEDYRAIFEGLELGTEATRTGIIENAKRSRYIQLSKDTYTILPDGIFLIESLKQMQINMDKYKTSQLGQALKKVYHGTMTIDESVQMAEGEIREVFSHAKEGDESNTGFFKEPVGTCPLCGKEVLRYSNFYGCSGYGQGCKFFIRTYICSKPISVQLVRQILETGQTDLIDGFVSPKSHKTFRARLQLNRETGKCDFVFDDARKPTAKPKPASLGVCPLCGKPIVAGKAAYGCLGWKEGCTFRFPFPTQDPAANRKALEKYLADPANSNSHTES